jgi:hypothetical protein
MLSKAFVVSTIVVSAIISCVNAFDDPVFTPQCVNWDDHPFVAPGDGDVRSPCPGLNTYVAHDRTW